MTFIVAEIGVNWDGNLNLVKEMIYNAKQFGCDAVKFQAFNETNVKYHPEKNRLINSAISKNNIEKIDQLAKSAGIEWFCTPMYPEAVDLLLPFVKRFKIRQVDGVPLLENRTTELLERILKTDKEVIVSSEKNPKFSKYYLHNNIKWLYCVPKYPCELIDLDFTNLKNFDGFSNHCPNIIAPLVATIKGAKIVEVHITSDKSKDFLDNNVSFDFDQLEELIKNIRLIEKMKY